MKLGQSKLGMVWREWLESQVSVQPTQPMMCTSQRSTLKFSIVTAAVGTQKDNQFKFPGGGYGLRGGAQLYISSTGILK